MHKFLLTLQKAPLRAVLGLGLVLLLSGNWALPLLDRDEPRFAEASREMVQRHDFVVPHFNGTYRFDKPPLIYWCQVACYGVFGENPFAARLPAALFATATAVLLLTWGRRLGNPTAGFQAALMFLTCLQVLVHGRLSVADMPMIFFCAATAWVGWEMSRPGARRPRLWWCLLSASLALGFLAKGPIVWLPWGGLVACRLLRPSAFETSVGKLAAALIVSLLLVALWGVPALVATQGEFFAVGIGRHVVHRSIGVMDGHGLGGLLGYLGSLPLYLLTFFPSFFPWSLKVPRAVRAWWGRRQQDTLGWYLMVQAALVFVVFSLVRTKLPHYTLPAFPCLALWLALQFSGAAAATWLARMCAAMTALALLITLGVFPWADKHLVTADLWRQVKPHTRPDTKLLVVGFSEPSLVWEFRQGTTNYAEYFKPVNVAAARTSSPPFCLVLPTPLFEKNREAMPSGATLVHAHGFDTTGFRRWNLTAVIKQ